jgi:hypothetical protein
MNDWKQYQVMSEVPVTLSLIWTLIKKWFNRKPYRVKLSFYGQTTSNVKITGAQIEY